MSGPSRTYVEDVCTGCLIMYFVIKTIYVDYVTIYNMYVMCRAYFS